MVSLPGANGFAGVRFAMDSRRCFVGGLSWQTDDVRLRQYFENFGEVTEAFTTVDRLTGQPRGFGFVVFEDPAVVDKVVSMTHTIDRREVEAKRAVPKEETQPSRPHHGHVQNRTAKIFVGGLASSVDEASLRQYFEQFGPVEDSTVMVDHDSRRSRGFGFVTFRNEESVDGVFAAGTMQVLHDKQIEIKRAVPRDQMPPPPPPRHLGPGRGYMGPGRGYHTGRGPAAYQQGTGYYPGAYQQRFNQPLAQLATGSMGLAGRGQPSGLLGNGLRGNADQLQGSNGHGMAGLDHSSLTAAMAGIKLGGMGANLGMDHMGVLPSGLSSGPAGALGSGMASSMGTHYGAGGLGSDFSLSNLPNGLQQGQGNGLQAGLGNGFHDSFATSQAQQAVYDAASKAAFADPSLVPSAEHSLASNLSTAFSGNYSENTVGPSQQW
ncbi:hypothetical protein WJX72_006412 [[Myrmecia] bisecta]|uniref:RRM domain-containing protein n=1 Tax=[Myrmecia] bisecta TaxID=41462 RepID=A0AAW1PY13_9CHLO